MAEVISASFMPVTFDSPPQVSEGGGRVSVPVAIVPSAASLTQEREAATNISVHGKHRWRRPCNWVFFLIGFTEVGYPREGTRQTFCCETERCLGKRPFDL